MDPHLMTRLESLEDRLASLDDIQGLSELLSIKYNPFLDLDEEELFERRHDPQSLVEAQVQDRRRAPVQAFRDHRLDRQDPWSSSASPERRGPAREERFTAPVHAEPRHAPPPERRPEPPPEPRAEPAAPARPASSAALLHGIPDTLFRAQKAITPGGARESFLAMHWFTYLSEGTDSSIIFLYLDYYHYVGWIDETSYQWLARLAEGVAKRKEGAGWSDYGMDVARLSHNHLRNLRFLDKMLGTTLQHGEADYLRQTVDMLLMEDG